LTAIVNYQKYRFWYTLLPYLIAIPYGLQFWGVPPFDPDLGFHLFGGAYIWNQIFNSGISGIADWVPNQDPINSFRNNWHDYHWLAQLIFYLIYKIGGYKLLYCSFGLLCGYLAKVLTDICIIVRKNYEDLAITTIIVIFALITIEQIASLRPQVLALTIISMTLRRLVSPKKNHEIWYIFVFTVVLANIHVYWIFPPILWIIYRYNNSFSFISSIVLLLIAPLISPYGLFNLNGKNLSDFIQNYIIVLDYLNTPKSFASGIAEFRSTFSASGIPRISLLLGLIIFSRTISVALAKKITDHVATFILGLIFAYKSLKFSGLYGITLIPFLATILKINFINIKLLYPLPIFLIFYSFYRIPSEENLINQIEQNRPVVACKKLAEINFKKGLTQNKRILTYFDEGGWCMWSLLQLNKHNHFRVTSDGRTQGISEDLAKKSLGIFWLEDGWNKTLLEWQPDAVIASRKHPLTKVLFMLPNMWKLNYRDSNFALFTRVSLK
jgi:hypothetical protein